MNAGERREPERVVAVGLLQAIEGGMAVVRQMARDLRVIEEIVGEIGQRQRAGEPRQQGAEVNAQQDRRKQDRIARLRTLS